MSDPIISLPLAKDWITRLARELGRLSKERRNQLDELFFEFGDWQELARLYIEPYCQLANPADFDERKAPPSWAHRSPIRDWINRFLEMRSTHRDGGNTLFVLADAGMGKTSLFIMLKLSEIQRFWPKGLRFELIKLGPKTLERLQELGSEASRTVLMLDALDEDHTAWGKVGERIEDLLHTVTAFRFAIITCRTQYFPRGEALADDQPKVEPGRFQFRGYECNLLYLSPFDKPQIGEYLNRAYPDSLAQRVSRWLFRQPDRRDTIRGVIASMGDLSMRPLLLAYVEDLVDQDYGEGAEYAIYERLVDRWLGREVRKLSKAGIKVAKSQLWDACADLALAVQKLGLRSIDRDGLDQVLADRQLLEAFQAFKFGGRSLLNRNSAAEYRFAHYSIQEFLVVRSLLRGKLAPDDRIRMTTQMFVFLVSGTVSETKAVDLPWQQLDLDEVDFRGLRLDRFELVADPKARAALFNEDAEKRREAYLGVTSYLSAPPLALLFLDQQRRQTRSGDDLYHLDLACQLIAQQYPEHAEAAGALRGRFYDHIPAPPEELFEKVTTQDGVVDLWCEIPVGRFLMGSPEDDEGRAEEEWPAHSVALKSKYFMAAVPVTQAQYRAFDPGHRSHFKGDARPVESVTWYEAMAFCRWLASHPATYGARLPSEQEWEIACRAGTVTAYWSGDYVKHLGRAGWYRKNSGNKVNYVGQKPANPWGLYDVHGNVWEWCSSPWSDNYSGRESGLTIDPATIDPNDLLPPSAGSADSLGESAEARRVLRVFRGGSCRNSAQWSRSAFRNIGSPRGRSQFRGFRVLLPPVPPRSLR